MYIVKILWTGAVWQVSNAKRYTVGPIQKISEPNSRVHGEFYKLILYYRLSTSIKVNVYFSADFCLRNEEMSFQCFEPVDF